MKNLLKVKLGIAILVLQFLFVSHQSASAQGLGVNATGSTPNASAGLDVDFSNKGMLIPRLTMAQRNAISSPATSLLIYQTDNTPGYYYNEGTPGTPNWVILLNGQSVALEQNVYLLDPSLTSPSNPYIAGTNGEDVIKIMENTGDNYDDYGGNDSQTGGISAFIYLPNDQDSPGNTTSTSNGRTALEIAADLPNTKRIEIYGNRQADYNQRIVLTFANDGSLANIRYLSDLYGDCNGFDGHTIIEDPIRNAIKVTYGGNGIESQWQYDYPIAFFECDNSHDGWGNSPSMNSDDKYTRYSLSQTQWNELTGADPWDSDNSARRAWNISSDWNGIGYAQGNVGIGTIEPQALLDITGDGGTILLPRKSDGNDPDGVNGMLYYNANTNKFRAFQYGLWTDVTGWSLTGNAGTNPSTNYIGTSDAQPLMFGYNGNKIGKLYQESGNKSNFMIYSPNNSKYTQISTDQTWNVGQIFTIAGSLELWSNSNKALTLDATQNATFTNKVSIGTLMHLAPQSSAPSSPTEGDVYYNSTIHKLMVYDGTTWQACW